MNLDRKTASILIAILVYGLALRLFSFTGITGWDDTDYTAFSYVLLNKNTTIHELRHAIGSGIHRYKLGIGTPVAASFLLFGVNESAATLYPLICALGSILMTYLFGRNYLKNNKLGLIAAFCYASWPLSVTWSSQLRPDVMAAFWFSFGLYLIFVNSKQSIKCKWMFLLAAGMMIYVSANIRETIILFVPIFFVSLVISKQLSLKEIYFIMLGVSIFACFDWLLMGLITGNYLFRYHMWLDLLNIGSTAATFGIVDSWYGGALTYLARVFSFPLCIISSLATVSMIYAIVRKKSNLIMFLCWVIILLLILFFFPTSLSEYKTYPVQIRYLELSILPFCLILSSFLVNKKMISHRYNHLYVSIAIVCVVSITYLIPHRLSSAHGSSYNTREIYNYIKNNDHQIWVDEFTLKLLPFFNGFVGNLNVKSFTGKRTLNDLTNCIIVVDQRKLQMYKDFGWGVPEELLHVPSNWKLINKIKNPSISGTGVFIMLKQIPAIIKGHKYNPPDLNIPDNDVLIYRVA